LGAYILRRLALMIPTLFGIMLVNFVVVQFAPGGPVEQVIAELTAVGGSATDRFSGGGRTRRAAARASRRRPRPTASIAARRGSTPNSSPISSGSSASTSRRSNASR
jgi:ABC-type microcin C transport system permease subunit YejB